MATRVLHNTPLPQTCGVGEIGVFRDAQHWHGAYDDTTTKNVVPKGGCGWVICSFTNNTYHPEYKQAYHELKKRWKLVFQSEVRINKRTGRKFFFCIFDSRSKP